MPLLQSTSLATSQEASPSCLAAARISSAKAAGAIIRLAVEGVLVDEGEHEEIGVDEARVEEVDALERMWEYIDDVDVDEALVDDVEVDAVDVEGLQVDHVNSNMKLR